MKHTLLFFLMLMPLLAMGAERKSAGPGGLKREAAVAETPCVADTIAARPKAIRLSGYQKTNQANVESFFATNQLGADSVITAFEVELTYTDPNGRMLHRRTVLVRGLIPPGETRALTIPAWDKQHAFHYSGSPAPKRRRSEPFFVKSKILRIIL